MSRRLSPVEVGIADKTEEGRPRVEVADIFRMYGDAYREKVPLSREQRLAMRDIVECRTAALGGHVDVCDSCGVLRVAYNSCRNRHCPKCGALAKAEWLEAQKSHLLPTHYFHVVFTIDHDFNLIASFNQRAVYNLLFKTASETLKAFGERYLGGQIGFTAVLHTWGQTLTQHIHLHCLVAGGALSFDQKRWIGTHPEFLFPIVELSCDFRDRFCNGMWRLFQQKKLRFVGESKSLEDRVEFGKLVTSSNAKKWQVFAKPPFGNAEHMLNYLGRYINRMAISNYRILDIENGKVSFTYRDYKDDGKEKVLTLRAEEFIRRFLQHVVPSRFVRIRHYGFLAPCHRKKKLAICRTLIGLVDTAKEKTRKEILQEMLGHDPELCPVCSEGKMRRFEELDAHPLRRKWQLALS